MINKHGNSLDVLAAMRGNSTATRNEYSRWQIRFLRDVCGICDPNLAVVPYRALRDHVQKSAVESWLNTIHINQPQLGRASLKMARKAIVFLAVRAVEVGVVSEENFEAVKRLKLPAVEDHQNPGQWLSVDQVHTLLNTLENVTIWRKDRQIRNKAFVTMMVYTGLRVGEIAALRWGDIMERGKHFVLRVHGKAEKTGFVKLTQQVLECLDEWRNYHPCPAEQEYVFVNLDHKSRALRPLETRSIWHIVNELATKAGLPPTSPHDLRRSFARISYEEGCSYELIRQSMRHAHVAMTEHYVNEQVALNRTASDFLFEFLTK